MAAVTSDPAAFKARYPQFCAADSQRLGFFWQEACLLLKPGDDSVVCDPAERALLLWLLTAHIAMVNGITQADGQPLPVGAINSATEGSVSVSFNYNALPGTQAWYQQTQFGLMYWQFTAKYRSARYIPQPTGWKQNDPYFGR